MCFGYKQYLVKNGEMIYCNSYVKLSGFDYFNAKSFTNIKSKFWNLLAFGWANTNTLGLLNN